MVILCAPYFSLKERKSMKVFFDHHVVIIRGVCLTTCGDIIIIGGNLLSSRHMYMHAEIHFAISVQRGHISKLPSE
jgi:hypothetical protein